MSSRRVSILERSTREYPSNFDLNPSPTVGARANTRRSVATGPSESVSSISDNPSTKLLTYSCPRYSAIGIPVPANGQSLDPEATERVVDESRKTILDRYIHAAVKFRNSGFIHVLQFLFLWGPVSSIIMGLKFIGDCPQTSSLPFLEVATGILGVVSICFWFAHTYSEHRGTGCSCFLKFSTGILYLLLFLIVAIEANLLSRMTRNFDPSSSSYCNETFYRYVFYKEPVTLGALVLVGLLHFPRSSLQKWCLNCPMPSPAGAFFHMS